MTGRRAQRAEASAEVLCATKPRKARRAQREIVEFSMLSLSSFLILALVAVTFTTISEGIKDSETKASLTTIGAELSLALVKADNLASENPSANFTIFLPMPRDIAGNAYSVYFSRADDPSCRPSGSDSPSCLRSSSGGTIVYTPLRLSRQVEGEIISSSAERAAVTYNSDDGGKLALSIVV